MATTQDQNNKYYAQLVAGLHGAPSASVRPVKQGQAMPIFGTERNFTRLNYSTDDECLKDLVKELTCPGSQINV